jgi:hypothetical protein
VNGTYNARITLWNSTRVSARVLWVREFAADAPVRIDLKAVTTATRKTVNLDAILVGR